MTPTAAPMPKARTACDVAGREREHAERGGAAGGEQRHGEIGDGRLERVRAIAGLAHQLVEMLDDVHVIGDREDDDDRQMIMLLRTLKVNPINV